MVSPKDFEIILKKLHFWAVLWAAQLAPLATPCRTITSSYFCEKKTEDKAGSTNSSMAGERQWHTASFPFQLLAAKVPYSKNDTWKDECVTALLKVTLWCAKTLLIQAWGKLLLLVQPMQWMFGKQQNVGRSMQWAADSYTFQDQSQLMNNITSSSYISLYLLIKIT